MKQRAIHLLLFIAFTIGVNAQTRLYPKHGFIYTRLPISANGKAISVEAMIDTGCSFCMIDSTFAVDSCKIDLSSAINSHIISAEEKQVQSKRITLDSLLFCGKTYTQVTCIVLNIAEKLQHYAPHFILGANILKQDVMLFNLKDMTVERCDGQTPAADYKIKWKSHEHYANVGRDLIVVKAEVNGKLRPFLFDTGSRKNHLSSDFGVQPTSEEETETASASKKLSIEKVKVCENVPITLAKQHFTLNFRLENRSRGTLTWDFLKGRSFVLNYKKKAITVLH